jgi:hypothetical protein
VRVEIVHAGGRYPERVIDYLSALAPERVDAYQVPQSLPTTLEAAESLPNELGSGDVVIAISIHPELLLAIPELVSGAGARALIAPLDGPTTLRPQHQRQLAQDCRRFGLEVSLPQPFCALAPQSPVLMEFCEEFGVGVPELQLEVSDGKVIAVDVLRGAPCGMTDFIAERLIGLSPAGDLAGRAEQWHAAFPCFGNAEPDPATQQSSYTLALALAREGVAKAVAAG